MEEVCNQPDRSSQNHMVAASNKKLTLGFETKIWLHRNQLQHHRHETQILITLTPLKHSFQFCDFWTQYYDFWIYIHNASVVVG
jgi:hypothetical protein